MPFLTPYEAIWLLSTIRLDVKYPYAARKLQSAVAYLCDLRAAEDQRERGHFMDGYDLAPSEPEYFATKEGN
jgi:hypothetical protein